MKQFSVALLVTLSLGPVFTIITIITISHLNRIDPEMQVGAGSRASIIMDNRTIRRNQPEEKLSSMRIQSSGLEMESDGDTAVTGYNFRFNENFDSVSSPVIAKTESARSLLSRLYFYGAGKIE